MSSTWRRATLVSGLLSRQAGRLRPRLLAALVPLRLVRVARWRLAGLLLEYSGQLPPLGPHWHPSVLLRSN